MFNFKAFGLKSNKKLFKTLANKVNGPTTDALLSLLKMFFEIRELKKRNKRGQRLNTNSFFDNKEMTLFFICRGFLRNQNSGVTNWIGSIAKGLNQDPRYRVIILCESTFFGFDYRAETDFEIIGLSAIKFLRRERFGYDLAWNRACLDFIESKEIDQENAYFIGPLAGIEMFFSSKLNKATPILLLMTPRGLDRNTQDLNQKQSKVLKREKLYKEYESSMCFDSRTILISDSQKLLEDLDSYFERTVSRSAYVVPIGHINDFCTNLAHTNQVLYFGPLRWRKGSDLLPSIVRQFSLRFPEWRFVVATSGGELPEIHRELRLLGSIENFKLVENPNETVKHELMRTSDILLLPSRYESFGMVASEALMHGMKIVCAEVGGVPEVVKSESEFVVEFSATAFLNSIESLINKNQFSELEKITRSTEARERFSPSRMINEFDSIIQRAQDSKSKPDGL